MQASCVITTIFAPFASVARAFPLEQFKNPAVPRQVAVVTGVSATQLTANPDYTAGDATLAASPSRTRCSRSHSASLRMI